MELKKCGLQFLFLANNHLGTHGAVMLADILKKNDSLVFLDLNRNKIYNKGLVKLGQALQVNEMLKGMRLFWNHFEDDAVESFFNLVNKER